MRAPGRPPADASPLTGTRRGNPALVAGGLVVATLCVIALVGPRWAPHDPLQRIPPLRDVAGTWHRHPLDPLEMPGYVLGTDYDGRDILSRLLWAVRPTLMIAALATAARMSVGMSVGVIAGWAPGRRGAVATAVIGALVAVPLLVVALLYLHLAGRERTLGHLVVALTVTGWASSATLVAVYVHTLRGALFIEAARSLGAGEARILWRHVVPQVLPLTPILASFDLAAVLLIVAELGFLGMYIGGGEYRSIPDPNSPAFLFKLIPGHPELSQMLSVGWDNFFQTPWLSLWAGSAFFMAILGFTLIGEGLRRRLAAAR